MVKFKPKGVLGEKKKILVVNNEKETDDSMTGKQGIETMDFLFTEVRNAVSRFWVGSLKSSFEHVEISLRHPNGGVKVGWCLMFRERCARYMCIRSHQCV